MTRFALATRAVVALAIGAGVVGLAGAQLASLAIAAPAPVFDGVLLELARPSDVIGDGATPVDLYLLALNADGSPITGLALKQTITGGTALEPVDEGGGLYLVAFTPSKTDAPTTATIALKGRLPSKATIERSWSFPVAAPRSRAVAVTTNPAKLTLGVDKTASVAFTFSGGDPGALAGLKLGLNATAGIPANVTNVGNGVFNALYTTPASKVPQLEIITAVDAADPLRTYGTLAVPLTANVTQAVTTTPATAVVLNVGGRDFGPVTTDSKGKAQVPIVLSPGVTSATQRSAKPDGTITEQTLDLKIPETRRVALFPTVAGIPSDARLAIPMRAVVYTADGKLDDQASVAFSVTAGTIGPARLEGGGVYVANYTPPDGNTAVKASISVKLTNGTALQAETRPLALLPVRVARVALSSNPATLPAAAKSLVLTALVAGPTGAPLTGRTLTTSVNGASLQGITEREPGSYDLTFNTTGTGPVEVVSAFVPAPVTGNQMASLLVIPSKLRLPPDGLSSAMLTILSLDEFGYPVPNVPVDLALGLGDGSVPTSATTNAAGVAVVYYTAGRKNSLVTIDARAGSTNAGVTLLQVAPELQVPTLGVSASAPVRAMLDEWRQSFAALRVERE